MNKPHKHAELIKKWADGAEIQYSEDGKYWSDCLRTPTWHAVYYRVKPEVTTSLSNDQIRQIYNDTANDFLNGNPQSKEWYINALRAVADAAIKQYIKEQQK